MLPTFPIYSKFSDIRTSPASQFNGSANLIGTVTCFLETDDLISLPTEKEYFFNS